MSADHTLISIEITYADLTHEQAIELVKAFSWNMQQHDLLEETLVEKLQESELTNQQKSDLDMYMSAAVEIRSWFKNYANHALGQSQTLN